MYNHNKALQSKNRVHISWDILYLCPITKHADLYSHAGPVNEFRKKIRQNTLIIINIYIYIYIYLTQSEGVVKLDNVNESKMSAGKL